MITKKSLGKNFNPIESFDGGINKSYHLLPARFISIDENKYILSNR